MKMGTLITLASVLSFILFAVTAAAGEEQHRIPDAPPEYLNMANPIDYESLDEDFIEKIGKLYKRKCSKCHGENGDGKGSKAEFFVIMPAAFSAPGYLANRKDGQLFWIMMHGSEGTEMQPVGPDSDMGLSEEKVWQLVAYIRRTFTR